MNSFDKVIGYDSIKSEMLRIVDMLKNREKNAAFGAKMPRGILMSEKRSEAVFRVRPG